MLPVAVAGVRVSIHNASGQGINVFPRSGRDRAERHRRRRLLRQQLRDDADRLLGDAVVSYRLFALGVVDGHLGRPSVASSRTRSTTKRRAAVADPSIDDIIRQRPSLRSWERDLAALRTGDAREIPRHLRAELDRLRRRLVMTLTLIREREDFAGSAL